MHSRLIKICGIQDPELAHFAAAAGADFVGLVFHPASCRFVDPGKARDIVEAVKAGGAQAVAVFVNHSSVEMQAICELAGIHHVQLHGNKAREQHALLPADYSRIYVLSVNTEGELLRDLQGLEACDPQRDYLLFDHLEAGGGRAFNYQNFAKVYAEAPFSQFRRFIAGGLRADNIAEIARMFEPFGVDVSSGVESSRGHKEKYLIQEFIERVRA